MVYQIKSIGDADTLTVSDIEGTIPNIKSFIKITRFDLERITGLLEDEFTKEIVMPLLVKMGFSGVKYVHGSDEHGRDVVFFEIDKFDNKKWKAAQVKAVRIHGNARENTGNVNIMINQISSAYRNPYYDTSSERNIFFYEMYVITNKNITPAAKTDIENEFTNKPVFFLDGQQIVNLLEKYMVDQIPLEE